MKKIIHIKWMHCISCEIILEKELKQISWIKIIVLNHKKWIMEVEYIGEKKYIRIKEAIEKHGFEVIKQNINQKINFNKILKNITLFLGIIVFIYLFSLIDLYNYLPDISTLSYSWAFLIWIIASVSTCLAITWWIIIWFARYIDNSKWLIWHVKVQWYFQLGRVIWFFILGWILWYIWNVFQIGFWITWILNFIVWFLLLYMGLNIIWILPSITKYWIHLPKSFVHKIEALGNPKFSSIVWALTFFLPCWFTQTLQLLAVSSWSFLAWGLVMMFFAIWTFPVLFSVWLWSSYFKERKFNSLNKIIWVIVIIFWVFTISNSYNLLSFSNIENNSTIEINNSEQSITDNGAIKIEKEFETINVSHNWYSTEPSIVRLKKGWNYKIVIIPASNWRGCMWTQVIPKLSNKVSYVREWVPIIYEMRNASAGKYDIVCWSMWMWQWMIIVE